MSKVLKDISIEDIENGTIVTYRFDGQYETNKRHFSGTVEARQWVCDSMVKEIEYIAPKQVEHKGSQDTELTF